MKRKNLEKIILFFLLLLVFLLRVYKLNVIPAVINGDEAGSILCPIEILAGKVSNPFKLTHDGSVSYIIFYLKSLFLYFFGINNSVFAVRFTTVLMSILSLIPFFLLLRSRTRLFVSCLVTLAFSSNYWFMNFSRISWIAVDSLFYCLFFLIFIEKIIEDERKKDFLLAGILAALILYNYMGGRIYFFAGIVILTFWLILRKNNSNFLSRSGKFCLFLLTVILFFLPELKVIYKNWDFYSLRAGTLFVFKVGKQDGLYYGFRPQEKFKIFKHQLTYSLRGFIFFDSSVGAEGIENQRLIPPGKSPVNLLVKLLFWTGLAISILNFKKTNNFIWLLIYAFNIIFLQIPSAFVPSWSRAIGVIPIIYLFVGLALEELFSFFSKTNVYFFRFSVTIISLAFIAYSISDISTYWRWVESASFKAAQSPTISVEEAKEWQRAQISWIKKGNTPFNFYEWQNPSWRKANNFLKILHF